VMSAKQAETRQRRLETLIADSAAGRCQERGNMSPNHRFAMSPVHH
jgi:hypothetical protein